MEGGAAGAKLHVALGCAQLQGDLAVGKAADDVAEEPGGEQDGALLLDANLGGFAGERHLHVGGAQDEAAGLRGELNTGEGREGGAG